MFKKSHSLSTDLSTAIPQKTRIFLVIVHFGDPHPTNKFIDDVFGGTLIPEHIIVVDHSNTAYSHADPHIHCVRPTENKGYFEGLQYGINATLEYTPQNDDVYMLCNNDLRATASSVENVYMWWSQHGSQHTIAGPFIGSLSLISGRAHITSQASLFMKPYIHGACIVASYSQIKKMPFTHLFLYWEDVGFSLRALAQGVLLKHLPASGIRHDDTVASLSDEKLYYLVRNGAYILERHTDKLWRWYWAVMNRIRLVYHMCMHTRKHAIIVKALRDSWTIQR